MHIPPTGGREEWPFVIQLPTHVDGDATSQHQDTFIPQDNRSRRTHVLPPSYYPTAVENEDSFVEYYLKATLRGLARGEWQTHEATLPIKLCERSTGPPLADWGLTRHAIRRSVATQKLIPGMEDALLSTAQRLRKFFHTSSVPDLFFRAEIDVPSTIQLEHLETMPFRIRIVPEWKQTSEILREVPQRIRLLKATLKIKQFCNTKCEGTLKTYEDSFHDKISVFLDRPPGAELVEVPFGEDQPSLDIGALSNLRFGFNGPMGHRLVNPSISPSFVTYNLKVTHTVGWTFVLSIAGEQIEIRSMRDLPLVILPPSGSRYNVKPPGAPPRSEAWIQPPTDEAPPPSFDEVIQHDQEGVRQNRALLERHGEASGSGSGAP
jgi:hypothetical protein